MLAAPATDWVNSVVMIAANLDTHAWVEWHGYGPLVGSLNSANEPSLPGVIRQFHFYGECDANVPAEIALHVLERQAHAVIEVMPGFGHRCCRPEIWLTYIDRISRLTAKQSIRKRSAVLPQTHLHRGHCRQLDVDSGKIRLAGRKPLRSCQRRYCHSYDPGDRST